MSAVLAGTERDGATAATPALAVEGLEVAYRTRGQELAVLRGVSFSIAPGESFGLVGESGCGKSTAALAALGALPRNGRVRAGSIRIGGEDLARLDAGALRRLRARRVSMVYQDASRALNPALTIGVQLREAFELLGITGAAAGARSREALDQVRIAAPGRVLAAYPHELSGGMLQRVVIAMALAKDPALLVLDEPTTALDATVEAEVLDLIATLRAVHGTSVLFISHNLGVIEQMCDRIGVLYAGSLVEQGGAARLLERPLHPYTIRLLRCLPAPGRNKVTSRLDTIPGFLPPPGAMVPGCVFAPRCDLADQTCRTRPPPPHREGEQTTRCHHWQRAGTLADAPAAALAPPEAAPAETVLRAENLSKTFAIGGRALRALGEVSLTLGRGETLGIVGESGSGKTTLARLLLGLVRPDAASRVELAGELAAPEAAGRSDAQRKALQIVFQNPDSALNRAHSVRHLIGRALRRLAGLAPGQAEARLAELVAAVRLTERHLAMRPRQLSGGLKQRVAIARAFAGEPRVIICDEPTSALDVSVQAAILNLLADLQRERQVSYIFISHDLGVVRYISDRIAVLYLGRIMELGPAEAVFSGPHHPYTEALLSAVATPGGRSGRIRLAGEIPSPLNPPQGCAFHTRCPRKLGAVCETTEPALETIGDHAIRCHIPRDALGRRGA
ncbi:ABC transporter ATP-binding protein [Acidiphilium sp.]|uniref:ABC transporter ATP-binding protein n=1 Tax=Acidiphilium sp. TaxID=527 RepID=UPI0023994880|nr:ABC transporter ATP-binding protein [Acidiphilium sp.]MDE2328934.1 ABC transporter ATP-binding protein [Rhodospirillales bacterium]